MNSVMPRSLKKMKILTYNIHKGRSFFLRRYTVGYIQKALAQTEADIIFLQEIHGRHPERHKEKFMGQPLEQLAEGIWHHHTYGKNAVYGDDHHGNAILSKYPIISSENIDISATPFAKRGLLHAIIDHPEGKLHVINVHLDLFKVARKKQADLITQRINEHINNDEPIILAGDFNDWRGVLTPTLNRELNTKEVGHLKSYPSMIPFLPLDRIYYRGLELTKKTTLKGAPWIWLSDHLPLTTDFKKI